jgi:hypothetical protein
MLYISSPLHLSTYYTLPIHKTPVDSLALLKQTKNLPSQTTHAQTPPSPKTTKGVHFLHIPMFGRGEVMSWCWGAVIFQISCGNIVKIYFHIMSTASYLTRESHSFSHGTSGSSRKKIKHFSYSPFDKIGKGFSSVVYRGTNDNTSTPYPTQMRQWR